MPLMNICRHGDIQIVRANIILGFIQTSSGSSRWSGQSTFLSLGLYSENKQNSPAGYSQEFAVRRGVSVNSRGSWFESRNSAVVFHTNTSKA